MGKQCCVFCAECSMNVHHKCQKKVANLCGVNQKLMAEALATIESKQQVRKTPNPSGLLEHFKHSKRLLIN